MHWTTFVAGTLVCLVLVGCGDGYMRFTSPMIPPAVKSQASPTFMPGRLDSIGIVVEAKRRRGHSDPHRQLEDEFMRALIGKGYRTRSRADIRHIYEEGEFQRESMLSAADAARLGRGMNVPAIMVVSLNKAEVNSSRAWATRRSSDGTERRVRVTRHYGFARISARMIDVETTEVLWIASASDRQRIPEPAELDHVISRVASAIADTVPGRNNEVDEAL